MSLSGSTAIDLFCGAGGFSWGLRRAQFTVRAGIDNDSVASRTHEANFANDETLTLNRDLTTLGPERFAKYAGIQPRRLSTIVAGPPCQGWSKVGRGKIRSLQGQARPLRADPRNRLYRRFLEYVDYFKPPSCVMENVPGMQSLDGIDVSNSVVKNFSEIGYRCSVLRVNASWFGVPQDRWRLIFTAFRNDLPRNLNGHELRDFAGDFVRGILNLSDQTTLRQAIADLPPIEHGTDEEPRLYTAAVPRISNYARLMRAHAGAMLTDHVCRGHNSQDLRAFKLMREGTQYHELPSHLKRYRDDIFRDKYKRLVWDRPAWTVTAHFEKDVYTHIHPQQSRTISVRETARIQSFPDNYRFVGHMAHRFRQIGNAVPPLMAWGIGEYVRGCLGLIGR